MNRRERRRAAATGDHSAIPPVMAMLRHEGRTYITAPERAVFAQSELLGLPHAFGMGDLRAMVVCLGRRRVYERMARRDYGTARGDQRQAGRDAHGAAARLMQRAASVP
jgi:hypothetical protein